MYNRLMLNKLAFANSITILTAVVYTLFFTLRLMAPQAFEFLVNAQFGGANIAVLFPRDLSIAKIAGTFVTLLASAWIITFLWAWCYNKLSK